MLLLVLICAGLVVVFGMRSEPVSDKTLALIDAGDGYTVHIWREFDGNVEEGIFSIYYEITYFDSTAIPPVLMMTEPFSASYDIQFVFANGGDLVCIYDTNLWDRGLLIIFDKLFGESWPPASAYARGEYWKQWDYQLSLLKAENPDLPIFP
jgi:hypothetical protein